MRLFVALAVPDEVREKISALLSQFKIADSRPRWVSAGNLHITLKFIGNVLPEALDPVCDALTRVRIAEPVHMEFSGLGFFPNARKPEVAWIGTKFSPNLPALATAINNELAPLGILREEKPFVPHLTIARFKHTRPSRALLAMMEKAADMSFGTLTGREFLLIESKMRSTGAQYTTIRSFPFVPEQREGKDSC